MKAVNLLPADYRALRQASFGSRSVEASCRARRHGGAVAVAALLGVSYQSASKDAKSNQNAARRSAGADRSGLAAAQCRRPERARTRSRQLTTADASRVSWDGFMTKLARVLPEDVWLSTLSIQETAPVAPSSDSGRAGTRLHRRRRHPGRVGADRLHRQRLHLLPGVGRPPDAPALAAALALRRQLQSSNVTTVGTHSVFQFTIVGGVNALPAKEAS